MVINHKLKFYNSVTRHVHIDVYDIHILVYIKHIMTRV